MRLDGGCRAMSSWNRRTGSRPGRSRSTHRRRRSGRGSPRWGHRPAGGAYTYDWIENLLGLNMHSVDDVLPEFQHPQVGDGFGYGPNKMSFRLVQPGHVLAAQSEDGNWVWTFVIEETQDGKTRLISRNRFRLPTLKDKIGMIPMEPASLVMERRMLYGIKKRAENLGGSSDEAAHPEGER